MKLLLDTHLLLWLVFEPDRVPARTLSLVFDPLNSRLISLATLWEMAIKARKGRLATVPADGLGRFIEQQRQAFGFDVLPITEAHVLATMLLPDIHGDPFDRMLVAQAQTEDLVLVSSDSKIRSYPVRTRW